MPRKPAAPKAPRQPLAPKLTPTTAQALASLLKSARDIMRKDRGLNGDLDRLPLLTWIMFLKFLDDLEQQREEEAALGAQRFRPAIEAPYRWRDWAADRQGITGDELLAFINNDEATRTDGTRGPGLFAYLRALTNANGDDRRDVIATVFRGVDNRMRSGYLLRDVVDKVAGIHFTASEELHTLGALYESMLREMRDAAGDSGEFYTPRAIVRFMVQVMDPQLGETVLDPAAGTGGFLVESFSHLAAQVKTVADRRILQAGSLLGCEPKSLPYLLCQMNLLLHGLDAPRIDPGNALRHKLTEIGERDRVDVILTNPPFGGEEERGIQGNFPEDRQAAETALLFLQLIMRRLLRAQTAAGRPARAAVVVPNGTLFGGGVCARIKADLLEQFNLHTVLRLPEGVFAPYTDIPTNVIFFDTAGPTQDIWFYEQPAPEGRRKYTKTRPLQVEELAECRAWWTDRVENTRAWKMSGPELIRRDSEGNLAAVNLDLKHPMMRSAADQRTASAIIDSVAARETAVRDTLSELMHIANRDGLAQAFSGAPILPLGRVAPLTRRLVNIEPSSSYTEIGVRSFFKGTFHRRKLLGSEFTWQKLYKIREGDLIFSNLMAWEKGIAVAKSEDTDCVGNHRMLTCVVNRDIALPEYLLFYFMTDQGFSKILSASPGSIARNKTLSAEDLPNISVPIPPLDAQATFCTLIHKISKARAFQVEAARELNLLVPVLLRQAFEVCEGIAAAD